jgi:tetratricopeptide (TPR) repeat protein
MTEVSTRSADTDLAMLAVRPQPLGAFPLPLGYMLIPAAPGTEQVRVTLLAGGVPEHWPASLRAHELALAGDRDASLTQLRGSDPVSRYNRFVLDPDSEDPDSLRADLGEFGLLVDLVLFAVGRSDTPPDAGTADGELAAVALSAQASSALAAGDPVAATALLDRAVAAAAPVSAPLKGVLLGAAASICRDTGDPLCAQRFEQALRALDGADGLRIARAELHLSLAGLLHEQAQQHPELLAKAIPHYHSALQLVLRDEAPLLWAAAHANLATAYLTMPMVEASGQLRLGVAAQSLRSALTVYTRETHPEQWASVQLNLANSLVYTPSKHQADNLVEAVELYEAVLEARARDTDPLGRARVLANQGNVLAHLGAFDQAKAKLYEARFLFEELGDEESVRAVRGVLDEVARQHTLSRTDTAPD